MKRINPETGKPFTRGTTRKDGYLFAKYKLDRPVNIKNQYQELWLSPEAFEHSKKVKKLWGDTHMSTMEGHIDMILKQIRMRSKKQNIPFNLTVDYLVSIAPLRCPVFDIELGWCERNKTVKPHSPSVDRIKPGLGYTLGNVQWISHLANTAKSNLNFNKLHKFADWIKATIPEPL